MNNCYQDCQVSGKFKILKMAWINLDNKATVQLKSCFGLHKSCYIPNLHSKHLFSAVKVRVKSFLNVICYKIKTSQFCLSHVSTCS